VWSSLGSLKEHEQPVVRWGKLAVEDSFQPLSCFGIILSPPGSAYRASWAAGGVVCHHTPHRVTRAPGLSLGGSGCRTFDFRLFFYSQEMSRALPPGSRTSAPQEAVCRETPQPHVVGIPSHLLSRLRSTLWMYDSSMLMSLSFLLVLGHRGSCHPLEPTR
jgi:hypothetical protein